MRIRSVYDICIDKNRDLFIEEESLVAEHGPLYQLVIFVCVFKELHASLAYGCYRYVTMLHYLVYFISYLHTYTCICLTDKGHQLRL